MNTKHKRTRSLFAGVCTRVWIRHLKRIKIVFEYQKKVDIKKTYIILLYSTFANVLYESLTNTNSNSVLRIIGVLCLFFFLGRHYGYNVVFSCNVWKLIFIFCVFFRDINKKRYCDTKSNGGARSTRVAADLNI